MVRKKKKLSASIVTIMFLLQIFPAAVQMPLLNFGVSLARAGSPLFFKPVTRVATGQPFTIKVKTGTVNDDVISSDLFYRSSGQIEYHKIPMKKESNSFSAIIPKHASSGKGIEYYVVASESAEYKLWEGTPDKPYFAKVVGNASPSTRDARKPFFKKWWFWGIAVAIASGVVAASSGGSDGNSSKGVVIFGGN